MITEERRAEHRARVAALRERFGDPNEALDAVLLRTFNREAMLRAFRAYCDDEITISDMDVAHELYDPSYPKLLELP